jgi:acyl-coenzyme A thioesterase PaaI-like protein
VIATTYDWALGMAIVSVASSDSTEARISQATMTLDVSYRRPATGRRFRAIGRLRRCGSTIAFAELRSRTSRARGAPPH